MPHSARPSRPPWESGRCTFSSSCKHSCVLPTPASPACFSDCSESVQERFTVLSAEPISAGWHVEAPVLLRFIVFAPVISVSMPVGMPPRRMPSSSVCSPGVWLSDSLWCPQCLAVVMRDRNSSQINALASDPRSTQDIPSGAITSGSASTYGHQQS